MRLSLQWLKTLLPVEEPVEELAARLTMAGLEVDRIESAGGDFSGVVVAEIVACEPHPDADRLRVCQVDAGGGQRQIVCGAPNARVGLKAPLALPGGRLPGGVAIKATRLRGVESAGMLCSARELGLGDAAGGLLELPGELRVGESLQAALDLDDWIIEVELTPNRGDCLCMLGLAREVAALTARSSPGISQAPVPPVSEDRFGVRLQAPEACPRYLSRVVRDVDVNAGTPLWISERLRRAGVRSLGPVVDVTNYVMLELGQPMHAFDLDCLHDGIVVRLAEPGETLTLLNDETVSLEADTLVIADHRGPVALAGIMGGAGSAVSDRTRDILFESAFFAPDAMIGKARRHGLHTDASHRFERGVDPELQRLALERATALLLEIAGGVPGPITEAVVPEALPSRPEVRLRSERVASLLGVAIAPDDTRSMLSALGFGVRGGPDVWQVSVPSFRFDVALEVDLIEELARVHGYGRVPMRQPAAPAVAQSVPEARLSIGRIRHMLVGRGFLEAINYAFGDPRSQELLDPQEPVVTLANPLSADLSVMRTTLLPGLLRCLRYNQHRQQEHLRLFETGLVFRGGLGALDQRPALGLVMAGSRHPEHWDGKAAPTDFYDLKGVVEGLLALRGREAEGVRWEPASHPALHPGQTARLSLGTDGLGWVGALHPGVAEELDLAGPVFVAELALDRLQQGAVPSHRGLSRYPSVRRDLALLVPDSITFAAVESVVRNHAGPRLQSVIAFDVYRGPELPVGIRSLGLGLILQDGSRTLTDPDCDAIIADVLSALDQQLSIRLRG